MWCSLIPEKKQRKNIHFYNSYFKRIILFAIKSEEIEELNIPFLWKSFLIEMYLSNLRPVCYFLEFNTYSKTSFKIKVMISTTAIERMVYLYNLIMIKNIEKIESLDFIKFYDIRPEFFQYNVLLYVAERKIWVKEMLLEEKVEQIAIELQEEEEEGKKK